MLDGRMRLEIEQANAPINDEITAQSLEMLFRQLVTFLFSLISWCIR